MKRKRLKTGFTTGTAAAAAAKAAVMYLLEGTPPRKVDIELLTGQRIVIPVHRCRRNGEAAAACTVIKDAGDDPDVTHGAEIGAKVRITQPSVGDPDQSEVLISGGQGVGRVTKPGLEVPPGEPAINPGPRRMITRAVREALAVRGMRACAAVEVFAPRGETIALKTLNARLGIMGGISILGTTGVVQPMSHAAFAATIRSALAVARASGLKEVILTTGRRSERYAQARWPLLAEEGFIQIGDFFQKGLALAAQLGFERITLAVFFGKALKMAQGVAHTHAAKSELTLGLLSQWTRTAAGDVSIARRIGAANTAREAFSYLHGRHPEVIAHVGRCVIRAARKFTGAGMGIRSVIFDYEGEVAFDSEKQF